MKLDVNPGGCVQYTSAHMCLFANKPPRMQHAKVFQLEWNSNLALRRSEVDMLLPNTCERCDAYIKTS